MRKAIEQRTHDDTRSNNKGKIPDIVHDLFSCLYFQNNWFRVVRTGRKLRVQQGIYIIYILSIWGFRFNTNKLHIAIDKAVCRAVFA